MKLLKSTAVVSLMTLLSRIFGFLRDVILARTFGASAATDAFYVALRIPNLMRRLFAEGSFSLAFVPVFSDYRKNRSREELKSLLDHVAGMLLSVLLLVVGLGMIFSPAFISVFGLGFDDAGQHQLASDMLRVTFPYALFISLTALAAGVLNTFGRFAVPAVTPVLLNIALICAALFLAPHFDEPIKALAWGVLIAGIIQLLFQVPSLMRLGMLPRPRWSFKHAGVRRIGKLMIPTLFGSSVAQINLLIDTMIASLLVTGSITWLFYSDRLLEFPLGVFGIALSTVILPSLSRAWSSRDNAAFGRILSWGVRSGLLIAIPAAVGLGLLAMPITATLFSYGSFTAHDVEMTAYSVAAYAAGLPAYVLVKVMAPAFFSRQNTKLPVKAAVASMVANMGLNVLFVWILWDGEWLPAHTGLAFASTLSAWLQVLILSLALKRDRFGLMAGGFWRHLMAILIAASVMGVAIHYLAGEMAQWWPMGFAGRIGKLLLIILAGGVIYLAVSALCGVSYRALWSDRSQLPASSEKDSQDGKGTN